ncbi:MAG: archease [Candidatus Bilamarchaeaceae archaeon]
MYRLLEHPSDIIVEGRGRTFESALESVANGMFTQMGAARAREKEAIEIESAMSTLEDVVVDVLTKIIAECESIPFTPKRAEVIRAENRAVRIKVFGERKQPANIIKAVTYHDLQVERKKGGWVIQVLFDI